MKRGFTTCALGLLVLLAACGDRNDSPAPVTSIPAPPPAASNEVPSSALATARAFSEFVATLMADDRGMGLTVTAGPGPTSETDQPIAVR